MGYQFLKVNNEGAIFRITLDRPPLNVMTVGMMEEMIDALHLAQKEPSHFILLDAAGKAFSAGVDIGDHKPESVIEMSELFRRLTEAIITSEKPVVSAVNGYALGGGCEVALCCDVILASERAKFGQPEVEVGSMASVACYILPRMLSWPRALELLLSGETMGAAKAEQIGLINAVLPAEGFADRVQDYLKKFLNKSPFILAKTKKAALAGLNKGLSEGLKDIERINIEEIMPSHDGIEGLTAFLEKRKPVWLGR